MIHLHHCPESRSMRTLWLLHEIGVEFNKTVYPFDASLQSEAYLRLNPLGRIPALEIDGTVIFESGAMAELLCERHPKSGLGRAADDPERAEWLQWVHFAETTSAHIANLTQQHIMLREDWMRSPTVMKLEARRLARCYAVVDARLEGRDHLLAGGFSAADIGVGQAVWMGRKFVPVANFPRLAGWIDRITGRPGFEAALPQPGEPRIYSDDDYPPWPEMPPS